MRCAHRLTLRCMLPSGCVHERANSLDLGHVMPEQVAQFRTHRLVDVELTTAFNGRATVRTPGMGWSPGIGSTAVSSTSAATTIRRRPSAQPTSRPDRLPAARPRLALLGGSGRHSDDLGAGEGARRPPQRQQAIAAQRQVNPRPGHQDRRPRHRARRGALGVHPRCRGRATSRVGEPASRSAYSP